MGGDSIPTRTRRVVYAGADGTVETHIVDDPPPVVDRKEVKEAAQSTPGNLEGILWSGVSRLRREGM